MIIHREPLAPSHAGYILVGEIVKAWGWVVMPVLGDSHSVGADVSDSERL